MEHPGPSHSLLEQRVSLSGATLQRLVPTFARRPLRRHSRAGVKGGDSGDSVITRPPGAPLFRRTHWRFFHHLRRAGVWTKPARHSSKCVSLGVCSYISGSQVVEYQGPHTLFVVSQIYCTALIFIAHNKNASLWNQVNELLK